MGTFDLFAGTKSSKKTENRPEVRPDSEIPPAGNVEIIDEDEGPVINSETSKAIADELIEELSNDTGSETNQENSNVVADKDEDGEDFNKLTKEEMKVFISGQLALILADNVIPPNILRVQKLLGIKVTKKIQDLQLTPREMELLTPAADGAVEEIFNKMSPIQQFLLALVIVYSGKI